MCPWLAHSEGGHGKQESLSSKQNQGLSYFARMFVLPFSDAMTAAATPAISVSHSISATDLVLGPASGKTSSPGSSS